MKDASALTPVDFRLHPVWKFVNDDSKGETQVEPVAALPVKSLSGCIVGLEVELACKRKFWALLGNVDLKSAERTEHFVSLSVFDGKGACFHLARYHDVDYVERGPAKLAVFLGLTVKKVFPIRWDATSVAKGENAASRGVIAEDPKIRLSREQLIALAVP